ncbi:PEP-CTERM sorting domain-containing protein [Pseudomonas sp.]|uniref:PEP-CTERM sorting domain-containing protein n=1 Tax=Pseudomonas sp. TaxID=306 RepID=UPI00299EE2D9|nr:PEP-CTERM sorting domain-containing protein [Pseudomonas sp.]MDX1365989.1 PEP-CTERM sorting domain-containing protein [Pseudomonas sp.]
MSMKRFARTTSATLALTFAAFSAQAASYTPTGVQNDVDYNSVLNGGWSVVYQGAYGGSFSLSNVFDGVAAGSKIMLAAKHVASSVFDVLAWAGLEEVTQYTAHNQTHQANGAEWYANGGSMGFAGLGDTIQQSSADINGSSWAGTPERDRLSWHTGGGYNVAATSVSGGWRSGSNTELNGSQDWQRYILVLQDNIAPVPEPETYAMLLAGLGLITVAARRRRKVQIQLAA